ncbi:MAG: carboxypeptidase-like regulatory domain-containing protein [Cyclobacteriaceae bacterium]|nr:carboxypeptidase-like regulatory domain-containing protein [Cyclobacteriaceae bacterium]
MRFLPYYIIFFFAFSGEVLAQKTIVYGKVKDADNGDPIPFANVIFKGTSTGTTTKFDGTYTIETTQPVDSVIASYIGYKTKTLPIKNGIRQNLDFQLDVEVVNLQEVVFVAEENPAFAIMRNVIDHKEENDKRSLDAYEYESYTKIEVDVDNLTDKFKQNKQVKKIVSVLDSIQIIAGDNGRPILPVFFSEALSRYYVRNNPDMRHEYILKTKVNGLGLTDGTFTSQLVGSTYQEYNFYKNYMTILEKEFVSPLTNGWKGIYNYYLMDSVMIGDDFCYRLDFEPKRKNDLAFKGTIWVTKKEYALKQIDVSVGKAANLNFIEKLTIRQELVRTEAGPWLPSKTRVLVDVSQPTEEIAGLLAKFYVSNDHIVVNQPRDESYYRLPVEMDEEVRMSNDMYWQDHRHEKLSASEINVYHMVDTLKTIPVIKTYTDLVKFAYSGYYKLGKVDLGPYPLFLSYNNVEGLRLGFGGETNFQFSDKWVLKGLVGYGFGDEKWKYKVGIDYIISRKPWIKTGIEVREDVDPVYFAYRDINDEGVFYTFNRLGTLRRPFQHSKLQFTLNNQLVRDINTRLTFRYDRLDPVFDFSYYDDLNKPDPQIKQNITTTEARLQVEWAKDRKYLVDDNDRISGGFNRFPIIRLNFTAGMPLFDSDLIYQKLGFEFLKKLKMGELGTSYLTLEGEYVFGNIPYPVLQNHLGNETPFYIPYTYNLMNNFEFVTDRYVSFDYRHHFEGKILNHVPLLRALKLRLVGEAKILYGGIRQENIDLIVPIYDSQGNPEKQFGVLRDDLPYVELGYGVENILKVIRVDFFHRLTYLDNPNVHDFGVKIGFQLIL